MDNFILLQGVSLHLGPVSPTVMQTQKHTDTHENLVLLYTVIDTAARVNKKYKGA